MNGVNNQSINPMITQNLGVFQELAGSPNEFEDLFPPLQDGQEVMDFPLDFNEVEVTHFQETQDINIAKSSNQAFIQKRWTEQENKRFIELKQQQPELPWKKFAQHFPEHTAEQCKIHWNKVLLLPLLQEGKLIDSKVQQIDPEAATLNWSKEENQWFIELKQQQPKLPWTAFAKYFPGHTDKQCVRHWNESLKPKLARKQLSIADENDNNRPSKRLRTESSGLAIPATHGENTHLFVNPSQEIPQELSVLSVSSPFNPLQEVQKILDFPFHHYEGAVNHLQEIQLGDPLLQSFQQEAAQVLANTKKTYQDMNQRLTETDSFPIVREAKALANFCQTSTYYFETVYKHFLSYQTNQESKELFSSQSEEFGNLYLAFLKRKIDETNFHRLSSLKERDYYYQNLNNLFTQHRNNFKKHFSCFSLEYKKFIDELFFNIKLNFDFLKYAQANWKSMASGLKEVLSRLQEIEIFFESFFNHVPSTEVESIIIARIGNEISLQDFYAKQAALMAAQKKGSPKEI